MFTIHRNLLGASTLALGVAACTAIFSFVHPLLLNPFSYPRARELVTIESRDPKGNPLPTTLADYQAWSAALPSIAAFDIGFFFLNNADEPEQIPGAMVTPNLFHLLGVSPVLGRDFTSDEDRVVILTDAAWHRHFAADPNILGRSIALDFARTTEVERYTVIGVLPKNFWMYYAGFEVFVPLDRKVAGNLNVIGRLVNTLPQAQAALQSIPIEKDKTVLVRNWQETAAQPVRPALLALSAASILLLLIASVNATSLLLARANARRREIAIRAALGATPTCILQLLLAESLQLALIAAAVGALLAKALVTMLIKANPPDLNSARLLPALDRVAVDAPALAFAALIALVACVAAQILPAIELRNIDLVTGLKDATSARGPRKILVTAEVTLSVVLLASAGLLLKTMARIQHIDLGFQPRNILVLRLPIPRGQQNAQALLNADFDAIAALPGVQSAALTSQQPLTGQRLRNFGDYSANDRVVSPNYFATLGIALKHGRFFTNSDHHRAVINEAMARRYWPNEDPIGRALTLEGVQLEIIGVAADTRSRLFEKEGPTVYRSSNDAHAGQIAIRTAADPLALAQAVRTAVARQGGAVAEISTMESFVQNDSWQHEQTATLTALFAALAFLLATVGLYGVISFAIARRRKEIGIRVALGASRSAVIALVLRESMKPVGIGLAAGLALSLALNQSLKSLFYEVAPADPMVLTAVTLSIAIATLAASWSSSGPVKLNLQGDFFNPTISDDGLQVVGETGTSLSFYNVATGVQSSPLGLPSVQYASLGSISKDGSSVLFYFSNHETLQADGNVLQLAYIHADGTGFLGLTTDSSGISSAVLSGDGSTAYAATNSGKLFKIDTATGVATLIANAAQIQTLQGSAVAGSIDMIFGTGLADATVTASTFPLGTSLGGTQVTVNGIPAPLRSVSPISISFQIPWETPLGNASIAVIRPSSQFTQAATTLQILASQPESALGYAVSADFPHQITSSAPAFPGEIVNFYLTGLGPVTVPVADGALSQVSALATPATVLYGSTPLTVPYAGLAPGMIGIYQLSVQTPTNVPRPPPLQLNAPVPVFLSLGSYPLPEISITGSQ